MLNLGSLWLKRQQKVSPAEYVLSHCPIPTDAFVVVMPLADRNLLSIILNEHVAGRKTLTIKDLMRQIARLGHVVWYE